MAEITLHDALERLKGSNVRDRAEGLADLKHVLRHNQRSSSIESLGDASFHRMYEALFDIVVAEQTAHARAKPGATKTGAANRISSSASALRLAVEAGVASVRLKTVKALLDHFIQTMPSAGGDICEPLAQDYPKAMRSVLAYQPHVEHLPKDEWERTARFCLKYIQPAQSGSFNGDTLTSADVTFMSSRSSKSRINNSIGSQGPRGPAKQVAEEMVACLRLLTSAPNAPVSPMASDILNAVVEFLQATTSSNPAHQDAFTTIGNVIAWTKTENIRLTLDTTNHLVRLIRTYWSARTAGLKEILAISIQLQPFIRQQCTAEPAPTFRLELGGLLETLRSEYSRRQDRDLLHLDDISFGGEVAASEQGGMIKSGILSLQRTSPRSEQNWVLVHLMAFITGVLRKSRDDGAVKEEEEDEYNDRPRKRQRVTSELDDLLAGASSGTVSSRVAALQILSFLLQQNAMSAVQLSEMLQKLLVYCGDENANVATWALVAVTSCAFQAASTHDLVSSHWVPLWHLSCRLMANASTCRAACGVICIMLRLRLVPQAIISELYQSLAVAFELSGPNVLCDTAIEFVRITMAHSISANPSSASTIANSTIGWLLRRWLPSKFDDRAYASSCGVFSNSDVVGLVAQYLSQTAQHSGSVGFPAWDVLGRAWLRAREIEPLVHYLLSLQDQEIFLHPSTVLVAKGSSAAPAPKLSSEALVLNHLTNEITRTTESWRQTVQDRPQSVNMDSFAALCHFFASSACVAHCVHFSDTQRQSLLQQQCRTLSKAIVDYVVNDACGQDKIDTMLLCFSENVWPPPDEDKATLNHSCQLPLCRTITEAIASKSSSQYAEGSLDEDDLMDMGNSYESQDSRRGRSQAGVPELTDDSSITHSAVALRAAVPLYASLTVTVANRGSTLDDVESASGTALDNILSLSESSILASRCILADLPSLVPDLTVTDTERLLTFLTDNVLQVYTYERSEVAIGTIVDTMVALKAFWVDTSSKNLGDLGLDMYDWCVSTALKAGILSPNGQKRVSNLLLQLCHVNTDYGHNDGVPSVRTSLFDLLRHGAISVQFHLAQRIATVFGLFVLSTHDAMFEDLQNSLPTELTWTEGLAMRLLFLAKLASSWHSLLRQSVYYIFETAGRVEDSRSYATACVKEVAASLCFEGPRVLFRLFAPQLLHTWLEDQILDNLPHASFGFDSLREMLVDVQTEVTAQLLMRGLDHEVQFLAETLGTGVKELLMLSFGKSVSYAISRDIVLPPSDKSNTCETRLRGIIGDKEAFQVLMVQHSATIMGYFFLLMKQDDVEDGWLGKNVKYSSASKALEDIKKLGYSTRPMPAPQQPSFKSKYLLHQVERFCKRITADPTAPWDSATFAIAARMLFDNLNAALGSLHNCTVLRKLRVLIATAGDVAVTGYPLELLLRGIRPYLTDSHCADDALGILKYLMRRGRRQLTSNTRFLCGMLTILLLETRVHMGTEQDSTTQETQHRETVQRMQSFCNFSVQYLQEIRQTVVKSLIGDYDTLVNALSHSELPGNAREGSPESSLLLLLVRQDGSSDGLLEAGDVNSALDILTRDFEAPRSPAEDALGDDQESIKYAPSLWRIVQRSSFSDSFLLWAGKAIGRAYAASGDHNAFPKRRVTKPLHNPSTNYADALQPYVVIVGRLCEMVLSPTRAEAGLAEYALRIVSSALSEDTDEESTFKHTIPGSLAPSVLSGTYGYTPPTMPTCSVEVSDRKRLSASLAFNKSVTLNEWVTGIALVMCQWPSAPSLMNALPALLLTFPHLAAELLPPMIHMILCIEAEGKQDLKPEVSAAIMEHICSEAEEAGPKQDYLLDLILYMRSRPFPKESTRVDRLRWLDIDYMCAARTATARGKPTLALMLAESCAPVAQAPSQTNRRASSRASITPNQPARVPEDMLLSIFEQVDEPDSFYGVEQPASLESVLGRLDYEKAGFKSLMFRSAQVDSHMKESGQLSTVDALGMIRSLSALNLSSVTYALTSGSLGNTTAATDDMLDSARKLQQWDTALPESIADGSSRLLTLYRELSRASSIDSAISSMQEQTLEHIHIAQRLYATSRPSRAWFSCLGLIAESIELASGVDQHGLMSTWSKLQQREAWMEKARFEDFDLVQQGRITTLSVLGSNVSLLQELHTRRSTLQIAEAQALLSHSVLARQNGQLQKALCAVTQVSDLSRALQETNTLIDAAANHEVASVLWESQENTASVRMLRDTLQSSNFEKQEIPVGRSGLLAQLGRQLADARLDKPSEILNEYLKPAISHLPRDAVGKEAGRVYHAFAAFCDQQLQNPANIEDLNRIATLRQRKLEEVEDLQTLIKSTRRAHEVEAHKRDLNKAKLWYKMDDEEFKHQKKSRETFMQQSLQNYLLALRASDEHNLSVLRFFALWLENSESEPANAVVARHLPTVPSWKFVVLLNQLVSRLKDDTTRFQVSLSGLMKRMCLEHPYHSVHHVYASTKTTAKDEAGGSRWRAAMHIRDQVSHDKVKGELFGRLFAADSFYRMLAEDKLDDKRTGKRQLKDIKPAQRVANEIPKRMLPPVTISLPLRPDGDYSGVPHVSRFGNTVSIMSGISAPKVLTAIASDGQQYKQLFKSGNDDLRQDAIMEQVFEEVSKMLQNHKATRQRNLHIRTYKVIPTSAGSGIIEFVPNSIPINEVLIPAHTKYGPHDMGHKKASENIRAVATHPTDQRVKEFRRVCDQIQPVMRHFFLERFEDPDEWFEKRTAYTRTTASVSMLGHVLGLGDRHGHNIMLDEVTGEVVHIDLGIAFEAGRVLPIPELVPFRLTRDIVDGMGVTKTEGIFRRCCEFTMDALREDKDSIMTLLNVLRYDPLYNWTISPLRAKRMQEAQDGMHNAKDVEAAESSKAKMESEAGEADRALAIVEKKLSKTLSTQATVNELIQQAMDEKNLATLFGGWAAWL